MIDGKTENIVAKERYHSKYCKQWVKNKHY